MDMNQELALTVARNLINDALDATTEDDLTEYGQELKDALDKINDMLAQIEREKKRYVERKAENAQKRAEMLKDVLAILREVLSHTRAGLTVKEIASDFEQKWTGTYMTPAQIQYILLHDMKDEVEVLKHGRNANTYRLRDA